jgi:hypothetical protein
MDIVGNPQEYLLHRVILSFSQSDIIIDRQRGLLASRLRPDCVELARVKGQEPTR